jgi:serine/threonine-protein kinase RIO1
VSTYCHGVFLYGGKTACVIDFPQAVSPPENPNAFQFLVRDVERVCQYFAKLGVEAQHLDIAEDLWTRYM